MKSSSSEQNAFSGNAMNILLITSEDNGHELSCYGDPVITTPNLDRLAREGVRFDNAYITQAVCSPSRSSILTGVYPHENGQIGLSSHNFSMFKEIPTLPSILKKEGYRTGRIGKLHVLPESAFPFDFTWNDPQYISFQNRDVKTTAEVAGEFMKNSDAPFFLMVNYADAHLPWHRQQFGLPESPFSAENVRIPPGVGVDSARLREHAADYYNSMSRLDTGIGMLLKELEQAGVAENTLVIYLADHGPQFSRGKGSVYELAVKVPFIVRWPSVNGENKKSDDYLVSSIDIMPTILDAAGCSEADENMQGRSLRPLLEGEPEQWRQYLFCEWTTSHPHPSPSLLYPQRTVRDDRFKLILTLLPDRRNPVEQYYTEQALVSTGASQEEIDNAPEVVQKAYETWRNPPNGIELYDLQEDPYEFHNLAGDPAYKEKIDELYSKLADWRQETHDPLVDDTKMQQLLDEDARVAATEGGHKKQDFEWAYVKYLAP